MSKIIGKYNLYYLGISHDESGAKFQQVQIIEFDENDKQTAKKTFYFSFPCYMQEIENERTLQRLFQYPNATRFRFVHKIEAI